MTLPYSIPAVFFLPLITALIYITGKEILHDINGFQKSLSMVWYETGGQQ